MMEKIKHNRKVGQEVEIQIFESKYKPVQNLMEENKITPDNVDDNVLSEVKEEEIEEPKNEVKELKSLSSSNNSSSDLDSDDSYDDDDLEQYFPDIPLILDPNMELPQLKEFVPALGLKEESEMLLNEVIDGK